MNTIKHIVFDIGRVLIQWDPDIPFRQHIPNHDERRWFLDNICSPAWNIEQDRGRSWTEAETLLIEQFPEHETLIRVFRSQWHEMIPNAIEGSAEVLIRLIDRGNDVTMLTNFHQETYPEAVAKFPFLKLPRGVTVSGEIGMIKPDKEIFDHHVLSFDLKPAHCLFFDDSAINVEGARAAGWNAELFVNSDQLRQDLTRWGVNF